MVCPDSMGEKICREWFDVLFKRQLWRGPFHVIWSCGISQSDRSDAANAGHTAPSTRFCVLASVVYAVPSHSAGGRTSIAGHGSCSGARHQGRVAESPGYRRRPGLRCELVCHRGRKLGGNRERQEGLRMSLSVRVGVRAKLLMLH